VRDNISGGAQAWTVVVSLAVVSAVSWGTTLCTMGMFLSPVRETFGASNAEVARSSTFFILAMTLITPGLGWIIHRTGVRPVTIAGILATAVGYAWASMSPSIDTFVGAFVLAGAGVGASTYVPSTLVISSWIEEKRGLAMGVYMAITTVGSALFPVGVAHLLEGEGWRATLLWIAAAVAAVGIPLLLAFARLGPLGKGNESNSSLAADARRTETSLGQFLRSASFRRLAITQALSGLSFQGVYLYIIPYLMSMGYGAEQAAALFGITNLTTVAGYLVFGPLADRHEPRGILALGLLIAGASTPLLLGAEHAQFSLIVVLAFTVLWGATSALPNQLAPLVLAKSVPIQHFGTAMGVSYLMYGLAMSAGPLLTGYLYDTTHSYQLPFWLCGILMATAALPMLIRSPLHKAGNPLC